MSTDAGMSADTGTSTDNETSAADPLEENRRRQRELYGRSLQDRLRSLMSLYGISQKRLAEVLGVSAPMLSQLMSARRVKMGNPRSHERMIALEQRAAAEGSAPLPPGTAAAITAEVAAEELSDTTGLRVLHGADATSLTPEDLVQALRAHVGAGELRAARDALRSADLSPALRGLLERALD